MRTITQAFALFLFVFTGFISCKKQELIPTTGYPVSNKSKPLPKCTDSFEGKNNVLATTGIINDFAATERASLSFKDQDYWRLSAKTGSSDKESIYLNVNFEGDATVKLTVFTGNKKVVSTTEKMVKNTHKRLYIGALRNNQLVTLLFEQLDGENVCYDFSFSSSGLRVR